MISSTPAPYGPTPGSVVAGLSSNQAGAHASLTTAFTLNSDERGQASSTAKDIRFDLPPGLVGNTTRLPQCTMESVLQQLTHSGGEDPCPTQSMVGIATMYLGLFPGSGPWGVTTPIYAIKPAPGEPVAFGFDAFALPVRLDTSVLSGGDYGVRVTAPNLSEATNDISTSITIWGVPADHNGPPANPAVHRTVLYGYPFGGPDPKEQRLPLLTNPQVCASPMQTAMSTDSWVKPGVFDEEATSMPPLVGCELLTMQPSFSMLPDTLEAGQPAGYRLKLVVPQNQAANSLGTPTVESVRLALPLGTVVAPGSAAGLESCSEAEFTLHSRAPADCPRGSQIGEVEIETLNLTETLYGQVYLASPLCDPCTPDDTQDGRMIRLYVQAVSAGDSHESHVLIKLYGEGSINQQTGQITTTFAGNPPLPFDNFELKMGGGPHATLANPRECGAATTSMDLTPWSSPFDEDSHPTSTFEIDENCFRPQFDPSAVADTTSVQAGGYSPFALAVARSDHDGFLAGLQLQLPPGLVGKIAGVPLCPEPQASRGECPAGSLIGHVQTLVGPGPHPLSVSGGSVYLTGPYRGAPFGLSIAVPANAGPFTLAGTNGEGAVVVRAAIDIDPADAHLTITVDPLPTQLNGIPLQTKAIDVTIDRPEFMLNPTSCGKMHINTLLTSLEGAAVNAQTHFQVTNCTHLGFAPQFALSTSGRTSRRGGASLDARVSFPRSAIGRRANIESLRVQLPRQLVSRLSTLDQACLARTFDANPAACPAGSRIGAARALTPILPLPLAGPAYFVSHGGLKFPELIVELQGDGVSVELHGETFISGAGVTSTTFASVPDVPIESFELYLPQGAHSALAANGNLCRHRL
ncbi:MAG: hypothetical protein FWD42_11140, partial [Solirubrobacterales bacterium]|nr:hypothetical protein [Solirubrobacterales bacterium]